MTVPVLQIRDLCFAWPQGPLFQGLNHALGPGLTWLLGDESSGKTTLLSLIAGVRPADAGELIIHGLSLRQQPEAYRAQVFWFDARDPAHDDVLASTLIERLCAPWPEADAQTLSQMIERFGLSPHLDKTMHMLSAGSRRKVGLAAALSAGAPLTLIDQAFAALDPPSIRGLIDALQARADDAQKAWLLADHEAHPALADRPTWTLPS